MKTEVPITPSAPPQSLDHLLNSAVILNWDALTQSSTPGSVRVEYHIGVDGTLEHLKMWNTSREYWSLICEFSVHIGWSDGLRFCNGYHSRSLSRLLQSIVMNQGICTHTCSPNTNGILEVGTPTTEEVEAARLQVTQTFEVAPVRPRSKGSLITATCLPTGS
jgi:hypothetical protein